MNSFINACRDGDLDNAKQLLLLNQNIDIHADDEYAFRYSCAYGHLDVAKWLWSLDQNIDIHADDEYAFRYSCIYGHLELAKWLWSLNQNINIHVDDECAFRWSCGYGHLEVAKWLIMIGVVPNATHRLYSYYKLSCSIRYLVRRMLFRRRLIKIIMIQQWFRWIFYKPGNGGYHLARDDWEYQLSLCGK